MKNEYVEKINKLGKVGHTVTRICSVMVTIALVCCIVATVLLALVPQNGVRITTSHNAEIEMDMSNSIIPSLVGFDTDADGRFELDGIKYDQFDITGTLTTQTAYAKSTPFTYSLKDMMWVMLAGAIFCLLLVYAIKKISALFGIFKDCETPFTIQTADSFKNITIALIPVAVMSWVMEAVIKRVTTGVWDIVIGIDLTVVMVVVVMLMMSEIFRYGVMLQTESDETL
ncbi:MAG: DUF2975 domain-containing protein [Oscillospiraceae bacterium]|nr:DUF2975 domain-containing protein [Oscillospiraceae bacterium]